MPGTPNFMPSFSGSWYEQLSDKTFIFNIVLRRLLFFCRLIKNPLHVRSKQFWGFVSQCARSLSSLNVHVPACFWAIWGVWIPGCEISAFLGSLCHSVSGLLAGLCSFWGVWLFGDLHSGFEVSQLFGVVCVQNWMSLDPMWVLYPGFVVSELKVWVL